MAYEIFDDIAFFYLALSVVAMGVLPWTCWKVGFFIYEATRKPDLIPLTRIQKLKLAQQQQQAAKKENGTTTTTTTTVSSASDSVASNVTSSSGGLVTQENLRPPKPWLTCGNITLLFLWIFFFYMLLQIPSFSDQNLASFKPYEILGIDTKATDAQIKQAYRKQSLVYHPDRNPSPEAAQQFILVAKAYETLTSETAKANIEKYGNPDGYQGVSVTIGLPSMLTKKENQMRILIVYFFLFIIIPPVLVWNWWRRAKDYVDGGLMKKTLGLWYQFLLPNMGSKFLIEFLTIAGENEALLGPKFPTDITAFKKLAVEVKPHMVKQRFQDPTKFGTYFQYSHKASVLLHAYMLRLSIPESLIPDLHFLLKDAHRFLGTLIELSMAKGFTRTVFGLFDLMQLLTQGVFPHDSPLLQLPHLDEESVRKLGRKNIKTIHSLLKSSEERLEKMIPEMTTQQWFDMKSTAELIPDVEMKHSYEVEDEDGLYEGDLVTLKVHLDRVSFNPDKSDDLIGQYRLSQFEGDEGEENTTSSSSSSSSSSSTATSSNQTSNATKKDEPASASQNKSKSTKNKRFANLSSGASDSTTDATDAAGVEMTGLASDAGSATPTVNTAAGDATSDDVDSPSSRPMTDDEILDSMPVPKAGKSIADIRASGPSVHSLRFPFPKHEKWWVLLVEKSKKADRIIGLQKVDSFFDDADVEIKFYAPRAKGAKEDGLRQGDAGEGMWEYEIHAICDSYIGVDQLSTFTMKVDKPRGSGEEMAARVAEKVQEEYAELKEEEEAEEEWGPWYYCYFPTFWELLLNIVVLGLLCVFIFNFLMSRGYWQRYVWPLTDFIGYYTRPITDAAYPYIAPLVEPMRDNFNAVYQFCSDMLHRDPFPKHPDDITIDENLIPGMGQED